MNWYVVAPCDRVFAVGLNNRSCLLARARRTAVGFNHSASFEMTLETNVIVIFPDICYRQSDRGWLQSKHCGLAY